MTSFPFLLASEEILFGHHFEDGADVLGHAAVDEDERVLQFLASGVGGVFRAEDAVIGEEAAAACAVLGIAFGSDCAGDEFHAGPDTAAVLPPAPAATDPLTEDGA